MEPEVSLAWLQDLATGYYPEPADSIQYLP